MSTLSPDATLAANLGDPARARNLGGLTPAAWIRIGVIALLLCSLFWPNLSRLWYKTNPLSTQPDAGNWQHGIFVPLLGLYYLYANREQLLRAPVGSRRLGTGRRSRDLRTLGSMFLLTWVLPAAAILGLGLHNSDLAPRLFIAITVLFLNTAASLYIPSAPLGFIILIEGLLVALFGIHPWHMDFAWDMGMVITLFGVVLMLCGWDVMKVAWFPIAFLVCALPWPGLVYSWVAGPLQTLAARAAVATLRFTGVDIIRSGTKMLMMVPNHTTGQEELRVLNVAEACAGLRSLMTFITVAAAVAFLSARPLWQKLIIVASAIPIAIFCNVMRVAGQGLLDRYVSQKLAENFAHQFVGVVMMVPAFLLILLVCWLLDHLFIDEVDEYERQRLRMGGGRAAEKKVIQIQRPAAAPAGVAAAVNTGGTASPAPQRPAVIPPPKPTGFPRPAGNVGAVARPAPRPAAPGQAPPARPQAPATSPQAPAPTQQNVRPQAARPAGQAPAQPGKPAQPVKPAPQQRGEQK